MTPTPPEVAVAAVLRARAPHAVTLAELEDVLGDRWRRRAIRRAAERLVDADSATVQPMLVDRGRPLGVFGWIWAGDDG